MNESKGYGAIISAIVSAIALIAAARPSWHWFVFLAQHATELTNLLPYILGPIGVVGAAISHPPAWLRAPWDRLKARIGGKISAQVATKVTP